MREPSPGKATTWADFHSKRRRWVQVLCKCCPGFFCCASFVRNLFDLFSFVVQLSNMELHHPWRTKYKDCQICRDAFLECSQRVEQLRHKTIELFGRPWSHRLPSLCKT